VGFAYGSGARGSTVRLRVLVLVNEFAYLYITGVGRRDQRILRLTNVIVDVSDWHGVDPDALALLPHFLLATSNEHLETG
jgi:hypothetical protein